MKSKISPLIFFIDEAGDVVTVVEAVEAGGHKIDLTEHSSYSKT